MLTLYRLVCLRTETLLPLRLALFVYIFALFSGNSTDNRALVGT